MMTLGNSQSVCILGMGLIGGSLLKDLHRLGVEVFGFNRSPSGVEAACAEGYDATADLSGALTRAQRQQSLIVIATPMPAVGGLLDAIRDLAPTCGITDVVSVKGRVYELVQEKGLADRYVGGHPMAGTADSGWAAAKEGLFVDAAWVVGFDYALAAQTTTSARTHPGAHPPARPNPAADEQVPDDENPTLAGWIEVFTQVVAMAHMTGAQVIPATVTNHDQAVARISHLPHLLAEALAIVGDNGGALALSLAAGSFRDGTRVAGSAPSLVRAMCETNRDALLVAFDQALSLLTDARANLAASRPSIEELVDAGYRSRVRYEARNSTKGISRRPIIRCKPGSPGWVHQLVQAETLGACLEIF